MTTHFLRTTMGSALVLLLAACSSPTKAKAPTADREVDQATVQRLEAEARALAKTEGCTSGEQCRAAPVGAKPCGGPRYYLPYCVLTTDERALSAKLDELKRAEEAYNRQTGAFSTCEFIVEPTVEVVDGACQATAATRQMP